MNGSAAAWFIILLGLLAANLPFLNEKLLACIPLNAWRQTMPASDEIESEPRRFKPIWLRLIELAVLYLAVGILARLLESRLGKVSAQNWEFYAVTACLFLVFAFPGFVFRYLRRRAR